MKSEIAAFFDTLVVLLPFSLLGCGGGYSSGTPPIEDAGDTETETGTGTDTGEDTDTGVEDDGGDTEDTETVEPATAGEPCWTEVLHTWHPNYGLPDCSPGLNCIGNDEEAWCTKKCSLTGAVNNEDPEFNGWCCGELTEPCDPQRYWLPQSMSFYCIPLTAELAKECDMDTEWTGENERCAPICDGLDVVHKTSCAQYNEGTFCTFQCDINNGDADCAIYPAFQDGCCGQIMGGNWCLIPELCD
jgi:hypothetical protein